MSNKKSRNINGNVVSFILGLFLNVIGTIIMVFRELYQSKKYGFSIETDDVVRYSLISSVGGLINYIIVAIVFT